MTSFDRFDRFDRFERKLPELFDELALPRRSDYLNDILARTATMRQRPGWAFPERWLLMSALARRLPAVPRFPWRLATALALLLLAAILAVLVAGPGRARVPAPFGLAGNGQIVFRDAQGRILTANPATGQTSVVIDQPGNGRPIYSQDGTRLAFTRTAPSAGVDLMLADADGKNVRAVNAKPIYSLGFMSLSPRGYLLVISDGGTLEAFDTTKVGAPRVLTDPGLGAIEVGYIDFDNRAAQLFRPPLGDELLFVSTGDGAKLRTMKPDGSGLRTILDATSGSGYTTIKAAQWSPDGSKILVLLGVPATTGFGRGLGRPPLHLYVADADGGNLRPVGSIATDPGFDQGSPMWSPDGTRIAFQYWTAANNEFGEDFHPLGVVDVATGEWHDVGRVSESGYESWEWSPDGTSILALPDDKASSHEVLLIDATTGRFEIAPWQSSDAVSWQRTVLSPP